MAERQLPGVKLRPSNTCQCRRIVRATVGDIARQRHAHMRQMRANLMGTSRQWLRQQQREAPDARENLIACTR